MSAKSRLIAKIKKVALNISIGAAFLIFVPSIVAGLGFIAIKAVPISFLNSVLHDVFWQCLAINSESQNFGDYFSAGCVFLFFIVILSAAGFVLYLVGDLIGDVIDIINDK